VAAHHCEQLLMAVGDIALVVGLVVRLHHLITRVFGDPVHAERADVEVAADEMEVAPARTLAVCGVRIVWVDVRRTNDVGETDGTEWRMARISHLANLARGQAEVKAADVAP